MDKVKFFLDVNYGDYSSTGASNIEMCILGYFLASDIRCNFPTIFREWALDDKLGYACGGNITNLEKDGDYIELTDAYPEEELLPTVLRVTRKQLVKIIDAWENVCRLKPQEVTIKYDGNEFIMETKD